MQINTGKSFNPFVILFQILFIYWKEIDSQFLLQSFLIAFMEKVFNQIINSSQEVKYPNTNFPNFFRKRYRCVNSNRVISNVEAHFKVQTQEWNRYSSVGCLRVYV